jgi:hypothetical protein
MIIDSYNTVINYNLKNKVISSTKNQSQSIPYFYKIVSQKKQENFSDKLSKNDSKSTNKNK